MGLMDKMKSAAQDVAAQAKVAAGQAQDKVGDVQSQRKMDELAKQLGHAVYQERTGRSPQADPAALIAQMQEVQAAAAAPPDTASDPETAAPQAPAQPPARPNASEPGSGDFKL